MTIEELKNEIDILKSRLNAYELSDRFMMNKTFQLMDGRNIQLGRGTGTKIGTAADQKLSLFGVTPVVQQANIPYPGGGAVVDAEARGAVTSVITTLKNIGINA